MLSDYIVKIKDGGSSTRMLCKYSVAIVVLLAVAYFPSTWAQDTYYRWTDSSGNIQLSDRPPAGGTEFEEVVMSRSGNVASSSGEDRTPANDRQGLGAKGPITAIGENPGRKPEVVKDPSICESARTNLSALENYARIRVPDGNGGIRYLDKQEIETEKAKARATMKVHCN